jgi:hypothetical protein
MLSGLLAMPVAMALLPPSGEHPHLVRALLALTLGLPLGVAIAATTERRALSARARNGLALAAFTAMVIFFVAARGWTNDRLIIHSFQVSIVFHLLVSILPFGGGGRENGFWQFNRILFQRFLISGFYAAVLFAALAVALAAIDKLLGIEVENEAYGHLFIILALVFQPWFFLGGIPADLGGLEARDDYPGAMKVFAQFILIPVVSIYMVILTIYLGRVVVTRTWPSGWIGYLVTSVAVAGTLSLLLVHPIRERADSRWVNAYGRWFYLALWPSIGMLLLAVYQRVRQYGVTENRYFLAVIAFWLAGIALFYSWRGSRSIRVIPVTLCLVALATWWGPWSATAVARRSQVAGLRTLLTEHGMLAHGRLQHPSRRLAEADERRIRDNVRYLSRIHGAPALAAISEDLRLGANAHPDSLVRIALDALDLRNPDPKSMIGFSAAQPIAPRRITGFDYLVATNLLQPFTVSLGADSLQFAFEPSPPRLRVQRGDALLTEIALEPALQSAMLRAPDAGRLMTQPLQLDARAAGVRFRIFITSLYAMPQADGDSLHQAMGEVLIGVDATD